MKFREIPAGSRFGRLVVTKDRQRGQEHVACVCDCGKTVAVRFDALTTGNTRSCGCLRAGATAPNWKGGRATHPLYTVWRSMINRCYLVSDSNFPKYGARGIRVCQRWRHDFWAFLEDMGERPAGVGPTGRATYSLDRIDPAGPYEPDNVRWATDLEQAANKRATA